MSDPAQTGKTVKLEKYKVKFAEYKHPEKLVEASLTDVFTILGDVQQHSETGDLERKMGFRDIDGVKSIYVFQKQADRWRLIREYLTQDPLKVVKWTGNTNAETQKIRNRLKKSFSRKHTQTEWGNVTLTAGHEYVVILSPIPLAFERIRVYERNPAKLKARGLHVPERPEIRDDGYAFFRLVDHLAWAETLHEEFEECHSEYARISQDPVKAKKRFLADMVWKLAQNSDDVRDQLRAEAGRLQVAAYRDAQDTKLEELNDRSASAAYWMRLIRSSQGFQRMARDYGAAPDFLKERWLERNAELAKGDLEHKQGLSYVEGVSQDPDSWMYELFLNEDSFQAWRKAIDATGTTFEELLIPFLAGRASAMKKGLDESIMRDVKINHILKSFDGERYSELRKVDGERLSVSRRKAAFARIKYNVGVKSRAQNFETWKKQVSSLSESTQKLLLGIEIVNLVLACKSFGEAYKNDDSISVEEAEQVVNFMGSVSDVIGASEFLIQECGFASNLVGKTAGRKILSSIGIFGAVCDYALSIKDTYQSSWEGDIGLATAHATTAFGAVGIGAGTYLSSAGGGAAFGLAAGPWLVIGALCFAGGMLAVALLSDSPIEKYAAQCPWGVESPFQGQDVTGIGESELDTQIKKLADIVWQPQMDVARHSLEDNRWRLEVGLKAPLLLPNQTNFTVKLTVKKASASRFQPAPPTTETLFTQSFELPNSSSTTNWDRREIRYSFTSENEDLGAKISEGSGTWISYEAKIRGMLQKGGPERTFRRDGVVSS